MKENEATKSPGRTKEQAPATQPERGANHENDLVHRLKNAIDERGRYSFRLGDMAAGLAAGMGVALPVARRQIEEDFIKKIGISPQRYLDDHYAELRREGRDQDRDPDQEMDR